MVEPETLADSIRRKVLENKVEALKGFSDCETTEVSSSNTRPNACAIVAAANWKANPLLPLCLALALAVVILAMLLFTRTMH